MLAVVGNKDEAHSVSADLPGAERYRLAIPAATVSYRVGEAMGKVDFQDLPNIPETVGQTAAMVASHAAHLAGC